MKIPPWKFIFFASLIFIADFVLENVNHKFLLNDFKVYYGAATAIASGKQVYNVAFSLGSGYFKYSPFFALLFYPLSLLPYYIACVLYFLIVSIVIILLCNLVLDLISSAIIRKSVKSVTLILILSFLCILTHLVRELDLGNINVILLFLLCLCLQYIIEHKMWLAGILFGFAVITKPFFALLIIPLIVRKYYKALFSAGITILLLSLITAIFTGFSHCVELYEEWFSTMLVHASAFPSPNTIEAIIRNMSGVKVNGLFQYFVMLVFLSAFIVFCLSNSYKNKSPEQRSSDLVFEWFLIIALIPSLVKTDTEHFLLSLPIIMFLLIVVVYKKRPLNYFLFALLIIFYVGNISDLIGTKLSLAMYNAGLLGLSNVLIALFSVIHYVKYNRSKSLATTGS